MNTRQQTLHLFENSGENLIVGNSGDCPITPELLAMTTSASPYVIETFDSGLTAEVYRIRLGSKDFTLKKKRSASKVKNIDGQHSFLNEVKRRKDFTDYKSNSASNRSMNGIVETIYANYRLGIILSDWIEGTEVQELSHSLLYKLFSTLMECEELGLFEWDLCSGNILVDRDQNPMLFDFGYMYEFDPLREINSNGLDDPIFNFCERFETRFLSGWLLENAFDQSKCLQIFWDVKNAAIQTIENKIDWLIKSEGHIRILHYYQNLAKNFSNALKSTQALEEHYLLTMFRSHVLDIEDDIEGKSCTPVTLKRIEAVTSSLKYDFDLIKRNGGLFYQNEGLSKEKLIRNYQNKYDIATIHQI